MQKNNIIYPLLRSNIRVGVIRITTITLNPKLAKYIVFQELR